MFQYGAIGQTPVQSQTHQFGTNSIPNKIVSFASQNQQIRSSESNYFWEIPQSPVDRGFLSAQNHYFSYLNFKQIGLSSNHKRDSILYIKSVNNEQFDTKSLNIWQDKEQDKGFFNRVFGGNKVEFDVNGSIGTGLDAIYQQIDNPNLTNPNRKNLDFALNQQIGLSIVGKIGDKVELIAGYDSQSTFRFQNNFKIRFNSENNLFENPMSLLNNPSFLPFQPQEKSKPEGLLKSIEEELFDDNPYKDNIIQNFEIGNVSMALDNNLIQGAEDLFGVRADFRLGNTSITTVLSRLRSNIRQISAKGNFSNQIIELNPLDYQSNQHFFLSHYFRDNYDKALAYYPLIQSPIRITRIEVWITNMSHQSQNTRGVIAVQDLGEASADKTALDQFSANFFNTDNPNSPPKNENNILNPKPGTINSVITPQIRHLATIKEGFGSLQSHIEEGFDYLKVESAVLLSPEEYSFHPNLGYLSLNAPIEQDNVLAVAYQYSYQGQIYQVGEFSDKREENQNSDELLIVKMLKGNLRTNDIPVWNLMMKNIYPTEVFGLNQSGIKVDIIHGRPIPSGTIQPVDATIWPQGLEKRTLLNLFKLDQLNTYLDPISQGDGAFDYIPGITVDPVRGNIIFPIVEPFGSHLFDLLKQPGSSEDYDDGSTYNSNQQKYVFQELYQYSKNEALQAVSRNHFVIRVEVQSQVSEGISIGAVNVQRGSVRVTAGGRTLSEGVDYTVNYQAGIVHLLDQMIINSGLDINISLEDNTLFNQQSKNFSGIHIKQRLHNAIQLDATYLSLSEKPFTHKASYTSQPVRNQIFGLGLSYHQKIPFIDQLFKKRSDQQTTSSYVSIRGEFAHLDINEARFGTAQGLSQVFIDDFDANTVRINLKNPSKWSLSSVPIQGVYGADRKGLANGYGRTKMAWYTIDPVFYSSQLPDGITLDDISDNTTRQITTNELFPNRDIITGTNEFQQTFDLAYFPDDRGPYNNAPENEFQSSAKERWAGIMCGIQETDLNKVQYLEFWLLDTFSDVSSTKSHIGDLVFHLGNISEDVLKDGKKQYENGLVRFDSKQNQNVSTIWGNVPKNRSLLYSFNGLEDQRKFQDLGLDGLDNGDESNIYTNGPSDDPASDDYSFYLASPGGIAQRYKNYNGTQNNAFTSISRTNRAYTTLPDVEDADGDQSMNTAEAYLAYRIPIKRQMTADNHPFVIKVFYGEKVITPNGNSIQPRWILFRVPINPRSYTNSSKSIYFENVNGFRSLRFVSFVRMIMKGFENQTVLRFASLEFEEWEWRIYRNSLNENLISGPPSILEIGRVGIEEHQKKLPVNYALPPDTIREEFTQGNELNRQNEESLSLKIENLRPGEQRGIFKPMDLELDNHKFLKMDMHAESIPGFNPLPGDGTPYDMDNGLFAFIRLGYDQNDNYYQIELPLRPTTISDGNSGRYSPEQVWMPQDNQLDISISILPELKLKVLSKLGSGEIFYFDAEKNLIDSNEPYSSLPGNKKYRFSIKGFPSLDKIKSVVIGLINPAKQIGRNLSCEVWFNELRLVGNQDDGGTAVSGSVELQLAEFARVLSSIKNSSYGFGPLNRSVFERNSYKITDWNFSTTADLGYLLPQRWGMHVPFTYVNDKVTSTPETDPFHSDILLNNRLDNQENPSEAISLLSQFQQVNRTKMISLLGVRKQPKSEIPLKIYSPENWSFSASYNAFGYQDHELAYQDQENIYLSLDYQYEFNNKTLKPFKGSDKTPIWLSDLHLNLLPSNIRFHTDFDRSLNTRKYREVMVFSGTLSGVNLPELFDNNYRINYKYGFTYPIFNSMQVDFSATTNRIIAQESLNGTGIWNQIFKMGKPDQHFHTIQMDYIFPFEKITPLSFLSGTYRYRADYSWNRGSSVVNRVLEKQGMEVKSVNTIQNNNSKILSVGIQFKKFKKILGLNSNDDKRIGGIASFIKALTSFERFQIEYSEQNGIFLPGFLPSLGFAGILRPGLNFSLGGQSDIRFEAAKNGWLTQLPGIAQNYQQVHQSDLNFTADLIPLKSILINLTASRSYRQTQIEEFSIDGGNYDSIFSNQFGSFEISGIFLQSIWSAIDVESNRLFDNFQNHKSDIALQLAQTGGLTTTSDTSPKEYGIQHPDVLVHTFLDVYGNYDTKKSDFNPIKNFPLPNWRIQINLLSESNLNRSLLHRLNLSHGYDGSYTINNFQTNIEFDPNSPKKLDQSGLIIPAKVYSNLNIVERFNPLIGIDMSFENSLYMGFSMNRESAVSLSLANQSITQRVGSEYTFGMGFNFRSQGSLVGQEYSSISKRGNLNTRIDCVIRKSLTVIRDLKTSDFQVVAGENYFNIRLLADYTISERLSGKLFYNHDFSRPQSSFGFPQTIIRSGISFTYELAR